MKHIKVIKKGLDVSGVVKQLKENPFDWDHLKNKKGIRTLVDEHGFEDLPVGSLQLIIGAVKKKTDFVGDSEKNVRTSAYNRHTEILKIYKEIFDDKEIQRCGFLSLPVNEFVGAHIDKGSYYRERDRYHISICGEYQYFCGGDSIIVKPGTFFWFNNKKPHGAVNLSDETRITFVFDVPHSPSNPQHKTLGTWGRV
jgi:hypothetical protein